MGSPTGAREPRPQLTPLDRPWTVSSRGPGTAENYQEASSLVGPLLRGERPGRSVGGSALPVLTGGARRATPSELAEFAKAFHPDRTLVVGEDGISLAAVQSWLYPSSVPAVSQPPSVSRVHGRQHHARHDSAPRAPPRRPGQR